MDRATWVFSVLGASLLALVGLGCNRQAGQQPQTLDEGISQLRAALLKANPQVQSNLYSGVIYSIRYENYTEALVALDRIAGDPSLNEAQKKSVNAVLELLKQKAQSQQSATAPAK